MKKFYFSLFCCVMLIISTIYSGFMQNVYAETNNKDDLNINSKASILIDFDTNKVLYENNADTKYPIASIVKLMTIYITLDEIEKGNLKLEDEIYTSENASSMGGSQVFIDPYSKYTVEDMLKSVIVASANDASVALAEKISGTEDVFVKMMNDKAKELGLNNTIYVNASGLPEPGQYSTARDVAKLTKEVLKNKIYFNYSTIWMDELVHESGRKTDIVNTNKLIRYFKGCDAGKTGSTDEAGYCLSASAMRGDMRLIGVVLGAKTATERFNETSKLLNYGFVNFEKTQLISTKTPITNVEILKSKDKKFDLYAKENYYVINKKGSKIDYEISINVDDKIKAPLKSNSKTGTIIISKNGVVVKKIDLVTARNIDTISYKDSLNEIISNW